MKVRIVLAVGLAVSLGLVLLASGCSGSEVIPVGNTTVAFDFKTEAQCFFLTLESLEFEAVDPLDRQTVGDNPLGVTLQSVQLALTTPPRDPLCDIFFPGLGGQQLQAISLPSGTYRLLGLRILNADVLDFTAGDPAGFDDPQDIFFSCAESAETRPLGELSGTFTVPASASATTVRLSADLSALRQFLTLPQGEDQCANLRDNLDEILILQ